MRALLSIATLLLVVLIVMKLSATQLQALAPAAWPASAAAGATDSLPANAAQQAAGRLQEALQQGAARQAEAAASQ
ncbi:MAG: hypothetical protein LH480_12715 [Rubrivivax sp.]|nr:hypothetical protein [Rubrivivax sp.]